MHHFVRKRKKTNPTESELKENDFSPPVIKSRMRNRSFFDSNAYLSETCLEFDAHAQEMGFRKGITASQP